MISLWTFFWWVDDESASSAFRCNCSGVYMLGGGIPSWTSPKWRGFQYLQNSSKILLCASLDVETGLCSKAALDCFSLVSNPLPSLVKSLFNPSIRTQEMSWKLNEGCFLPWDWESHFLGRLIRSLGVPKERGVWNSQGGRKDKLFFPLHSLGLYNNNVSCLGTVSGLNLLANPVILKCKLWE